MSRVSIIILIMLLPHWVYASEKQAELPSYSKIVEKKTAGKFKKIPKEIIDTMMSAAKRQRAAMPDPGLKKGDKAPDFNLPDASGHRVRLYEQLRKGPVILTFYRGGWCMFCNMYLNALNKSMPEFKKHGASVFAITPQLQKHSVAQLEKAPLKFKILSDIDCSVIKAYRLHFILDPLLDALYRTKFKLDVASYNYRGNLDLPVPATYVISTNGIILAAYTNTDYKKRMEPADILKSLDSDEK